MARMVEVVIDSVRVSLVNQQRIVVLRELNEERYLPVWIGPYEAEAITIGLQEIEVARPQTHDLIRNVLNAFHARLARVEIIELREDVFFANLVVETDGTFINVDSRPSDALALAVRYGVTIYVDSEVMETAAVHPDQDAVSTPPPAEGSGPLPPDDLAPDESPADPGSLSVFEDFLSRLDLDKPSDSAGEDDQPEKPDVD